MDGYSYMSDELNLPVQPSILTNNSHFGCVRTALVEPLSLYGPKRDLRSSREKLLFNLLAFYIPYA